MLNRTEDGFVYVKVPDDYIFGTLKLLGDEAVQPPPYFGKGKVGAHISVIYAEESKGKQIILPQVGKTIEFTLVNFSKVKVEDGNRIIYMFTVDAPELARIRAINDLPPNLHGFEFHITVGVQYLNPVHKS